MAENGKPLGLYEGSSTFGNVCEDGVSLVGELVQAVAAATCIAKIADAALRANPYSKPLSGQIRTWALLLGALQRRRST